MNYKKVLYIIIPLLAIAFVVFRLKSNKTEAEKKIYQYNKEQPIHVATERVYEQNIGNVFSFTGSFEPDKESKLSAEVQGKINEIYVDLGQQVAKGQLLVQLDNVLLQQQINAIDVQIEGLSSDVQRYTILANADAVQGIQLEKSVLALKSAKIQKATLLEQLNKTKIVAPFSGVITAKMNEVGAFAAPGVPLLQLTEIAALRFTINVSEMEVSKFQIGKSFFEDFNFDEYDAVQVKVNVILEKKSTLLELTFKHQGTVNVLCDLTGEPFDLPIKGKINLLVKFGEEFNNDNEELLILPHGEHQLDVKQYIYEMIVLSVPQKKVHPGVKDGSLQTPALEKLKSLSVGEPKTEKESETDPRWDQLKKLLTDK